MGYTEADCDDCNNPIDGKMYHDYDGIVRCEECYLICKISSIQANIKKKEDWIERVHLEPLREKKEKCDGFILRLRKLREGK